MLTGNSWGISLRNFPAGPKVQVNLYFESFCGGCRAFVTKQLGPNFDKFKKHVDVRLNPFGNAQMNLDPATGRYNFTCQHGPRECTGGLLETCLIAKMKTESPVPTIACIESTSDPSNPDNTRKCMEETGVTSPTIDEVLKCATGDEGNQLFAQFGLETQSLDPPHEYVPWILFDQVHDDNIEEEALQDLPAALCKHFLSGVPECNP